MTRGMGGHSPSNISHHLKGIDFPAQKNDLLKQAEQNGADEEVLDTLKRMPDERYENMADVMKGYGSVH
ncbi:DUF2795 domain-containing protein [Azotobacter salinestris]|uniref:DUF2795 domain-containing protein n=1 Tax=Azotobacter salinestris TaxID=69964 RepID=UPI001FCB01DB|nr:DUF2795 domain-containing protein [Azotobacter salinestris]